MKFIHSIFQKNQINLKNSIENNSNFTKLYRKIYLKNNILDTKFFQYFIISKVKNLIIIKITRTRSYNLYEYLAGYQQ